MIALEAAGASVLKCEQCGAERRRTAHAARNRFCSSKCSGESRRLPPACCEICGKEMTARQTKSRQKFCCYACFGESVRRNAQRAETRCAHCSKPFKFSASSERKFCSYACHLASGGAWRAGLASKKAAMRYGAKKDANHHEVVAALEKAGASVLDMSAIGGGFPDLIVGFRNLTLLMEIKNPKTAYGRRGFNKNQVRWQESWRGGPVALVDGPEAALRALGVMA